MERFSSLVDIASCTEDHESLVYTFVNATAYQAIQQEWEWVNQDDTHSFILTTVDVDGCRTDQASIQPFQVDAVSWNNASLTATLTVTVKNWTDFFNNSTTHNNTWKLHVDSRGLAPGTLAKRVNSSFPIPLAHNFSGTILSPIKKGATILSLNCSDCFTQGSLDFTILAYFDGIQLDGFVEMTPADLGATTILSFGADGNLTSPLQHEFELPSIKLPYSISIAGIFTLGPVLDIGINSEVVSLDAEAYVTFGAEMMVPATSIARLSFNNTSNATFQGWLPNVTPVEPQVHLGNNFSLSLAAGPEIVLALEAAVLGIGFAAGLSLRAPQLEIDVGLAVRSLGPTTTTVFASTQTITDTVTATTAASTTAPAKGFAALVERGTPTSTSTSTSTGSASTMAEPFCHDTNVEAGMTVKLNIDVVFLFFAGFGVVSDIPDNGVDLYSSSWPLYGTCLPLVERTPSTVTATATDVVTVTAATNGAMATASVGGVGVTRLTVLVCVVVAVLVV